MKQIPGKSFVSVMKNRTGNVLVLTALAMPLIIGFAGLATDSIMWSLDKRQLQRSADSAALSGAFAKAQSQNSIASATDDIADTNTLVLFSAPTIETPPTAGAYAGETDAVRVVLQTQRNLPFSSLFLSSAPVIEVDATASVLNNGNYCVISLDDSTDTGVIATGSAMIDLNCGIFANSRSGNAVSVGGASSVVSTPVGAVGGLSASSSYQSPTTLLPYSNPQDDPFADLPEPEPTDCAAKVRVQPHQTVTITPGCYRGMDIKGTAHFEPGVYYIDGDALSFGAQAEVTGDGVTFILTSEDADTDPESVADLEMNGGAEIELSSPTSGTYEGVLIYQDRRAETGETNTINGNSGSELEGAFYFPKQDLLFNGDSGMTTDCIQLIGNHITFSGNSSISNDCPTGGGAQAFVGTVVRLVE